MPATDRLLADLLGIAQESGARAMALWVPDRPPAHHWEKTPGQPVCEADMTVDALLRERLGALLPQAAWLSEESAETPGRAQSRLAWVIDPIDGTRDFVAGRPGWAVSIALVEAGEVRIGILVAPARAECWWAVRGEGAFRNEVRLRCGAHDQLAGARVPADHLRGMNADYALVPKPNSIALRMAMVAADEADLVASVRWGGEWDIAAASLIAQEAGATVTDALGRAVAFNRPDPRTLGMLCSVPPLHDAAAARLHERAAALLDAG